MRGHQRVVLRNLLAHGFLLLGAAHPGQQLRFKLAADVALHHHLRRAGDGVDVYAGQGGQFVRGGDCFEIGSYQRLLAKRWSLIFFKQWQRCRRRQHRGYVQRLKPHAVDQPIRQRMRRAGKFRRAHMRISTVERLAPAPCGVGHAQHAAQQLLHRCRAAKRLQRAQHIGKRAIPALAQRLHRDDKAHRAVAPLQIQPV